VKLSFTFFSRQIFVLRLPCVTSIVGRVFSIEMFTIKIGSNVALITLQSSVAMKSLHPFVLYQMYQLYQMLRLALQTPSGACHNRRTVPNAPASKHNSFFIILMKMFDWPIKPSVLINRISM